MSENFSKGRNSALPRPRATETPANGNLYGSIQVSRGVAAMLVVCFHIGGAFAAQKYFNAPIYTQLLRFSSAGVEFFFVLSGFIIAFVHTKDFGDKSRLIPYLLRRGIRIYPAYWLVFGIVATIALLTPEFRAAVPLNPVALLKAVALLPQDPRLDGGTGAPLIVVAWSMQYELIFYSIFALFIISLRLGVATVILLTVWWSLSASDLVGAAIFPLEFMRPHFFLIFLVGVLVAWIVRQNIVRTPLLWLLGASLLYISLSGYEIWEMMSKSLTRTPPRNDMVSVGYGIASGALVCALLALERTGLAPLPKGLTLIGDASYALYLLHFPIISAMCKVLTKVSSNDVWIFACFIAIFLTCCCVAILFHIFIERPINGLLKKRLIF